MDISTELKDFIVSFCREMRIKNIDYDNISFNTSLDLDLNILDLDIDIFIVEFSKKFKVDIANFTWNKSRTYPSGKGMSILYIFFRSFDYRKKWVKRICRKLYTPKVYIRDFYYMIDER